MSDKEGPKLAERPEKEGRKIAEPPKAMQKDTTTGEGANIKKLYPERTLAVFVKPPSIEELKIRLKKRKTESEDRINMRIAKASVELATAPQFDYIIENNQLDLALEEAYDLVLKFLQNRTLAK